jgi:integrase
MANERTKYLQRPKPGVIYFRFAGKITRLPADETSPDFARAYDRLLAEAQTNASRDKGGRPPDYLKAKATRLVTHAGGKKKFHPPSIGWFIEQWLASDFFARPDKPRPKDKPFRLGTQYNYRLGVELLQQTKGADGTSMADLPLDRLTPRLANLYIQKIKRQRSGSTALIQKNILSNLWKFARRFVEFNPGHQFNPMAGREIEPPYKVRQEHKPWPQDVQDRFLSRCDENLYFAFHLLLCTGQRVSDVAAMKWSQLQGEHIHLVQIKDREGRPMRIRAPRQLMQLITKRERVSIYILTHKWQRPYTRDSLTHRIKDVLKANGDAGYTTHGLRKNAGIALALNGATVQQIMACLGHKTEKMALYYTRLALQGELADQGAAIMDRAFAEQQARRKAEARNQIKLVSRQTRE